MPVFGVIPPEPKRIHSWDGCAPGFVRKVEALLADLERDNWHPQVGETLRSTERVEWLHGFGRDYDDDRGIVTGATDGSTTWHGYGLAVDIWNGALKAPWAIGGTAFADALRDAAAEHDLTWGGAWKMADYPHLQWAPMR